MRREFSEIVGTVNDGPLSTREVAEAREVLEELAPRELLGVPCDTRVTVRSADGTEQVVYDSNPTSTSRRASMRETVSLTRSKVENSARMLDGYRREAIIKARTLQKSKAPEYQIGYEIGLANAYEISAKAVRDAVR